MIEILDDLVRWDRGGHTAVVARVVDVDGSGPRLPGAAMAVNELSEVAGSVSGGCVEGAVVAEALEIHEGGSPKLVEFGYSDDEAFAVGLTCGGTVHLTGGDDAEIGIDALFHGPDAGLRSEHVLKPGAVITHLSLQPAPHSGFYAVKEKQSFDWPR